MTTIKTNRTKKFIVYVNVDKNQCHHLFWPYVCVNNQQMLLLKQISLVNLLVYLGRYPHRVPEVGNSS